MGLGEISILRSDLISCARGVPFREPRRGGPLGPAQGGVETSEARTDATLGSRQNKKLVLKGRPPAQESEFEANANEPSASVLSQL